jgi:hypothetical protein
MATLTIHLQDGFADDSVVVRVGGCEVLNKRGVRTRLNLGYAEVVEAQVPEGRASIEVAVPTRNLRQAFDVEVTPRTHLAISISGDTIRHFVSRKALGYM